MGIFKNDDKQSSAFGFDEKSMAGKAVKAVRWIYAITGVLALVAGIALLSKGTQEAEEAGRASEQG